MSEEKKMITRKNLEQIIEPVPAIKKGKDVGYLQDTIHLEESIKMTNPYLRHDGY